MRSARRKSALSGRMPVAHAEMIGDSRVMSGRAPQMGARSAEAVCGTHCIFLVLTTWTGVRAGDGGGSKAEMPPMACSGAIVTPSFGPFGPT